MAMTGKKTFKKMICLALSVVLTCGSPAAAGGAKAADVPGMDAKPTKNNIMQILNRYDQDGAFIMKKQVKKGDDITGWFGGERIIDRIGTAVHEETHGYSYAYAKRGKRAYYVGGKKLIQVPRTKIYKTKKMASSIPKDLRTFRYNTYIAKPVRSLASNIDGVYGLMNEFMAYRAGMKNTVSLFGYFVSQNADEAEWNVFVNQCENDRLAYAEFKYYILHYLYYAKKHKPAVYKGIIKNRQFCKAYRKLEGSYRKLIAAYEKDLLEMQKILENRGYRVTITDDDVYIGSDKSARGTGRFTAEYDRLQREMKKSRYSSIHKKMVKNGK